MLRCKIGLHKYKLIKSVRCTVTIGGVFVSPHEVAAIVKIEKCLYCPKERAIATTGIHTTEVDVEFVKSNICEDN